MTASTKAFAFRFESLLNLRRLKEDQARAEFARARRDVLAQNEILLASLKEEQEGKAAARELKKSAIDPVQLALHDGYARALERRIRREFERLQELARIEAEKRRILTRRMKDVKVLERLRERRAAAHALEEGREEQKVLDEVAQNRGRDGGA